MYLGGKNKYLLSYGMVLVMSILSLSCLAIKFILLIQIHLSFSKGTLNIT